MGGFVNFIFRRYCAAFRPRGPRMQRARAAGPSGRGRWGRARAVWSVVVPTYDRLPILKKSLAALEAQVRPPKPSRPPAPWRPG